MIISNLQFYDIFWKHRFESISLREQIEAQRFALGFFSYKTVGSPAPVRPCTEKARKAAGLWASICLAPPRRAGEEGCGARSAANPDNIPFFEFQSQADLCGYV